MVILMTANQPATWLIAAIALWAITTSAHAKVVIDRYTPTDKFVSIKVVGEIQYEEEDALEDAIETVQRKKFNLKLNAVVLNTRGGNVDAALKMGRLIRKHGLNTYLAPNSECASACILVLIGGITRMAFGELSVHRSGVDSNSPTTLEKLKKRNDDNTKEVNDYVEEMGISPLLADAILMTPNWRTRELTWRDRTRWGVHGMDTIHEEMWFRDASRSAKLTVPVFTNTIFDHFKHCENEAKKFRSTFMNVLKRILPQKGESHDV